MKRDGLFSWISVDNIKNLYGAIVSVANKMRYDDYHTFDNPHDIPDVATVTAMIAAGGGGSSKTPLSFTQTDLVSDGSGGFYLPTTGLTNIDVIAPNAIVEKTGVFTSPKIELTEDRGYITGFTDNATQTITINII